MDDQQKSRMIIIAVAGVFGIGGLGWWMMTQNSAADKAESQANGNLAQPVPGAAPATAPATTPAATPVASTPAATPQADAGVPKSTAGLTSLAGAAPDSDVAPGAPTASTPAPVASGEKIASADTGLSSAAASTPVAPAATPPTPAAPVKAGIYPATRREDAVSSAKQVAGREDPMRGHFDKAPYPAPYSKAGENGARTTQDDEKDEKAKAEKEHNYATAKGGSTTVPPPPPRSEKPVPPPPPSGTGSGAPIASGGSGNDLPLDQLPQAPDKPLVSPNLKLSAIMGNKAVLSVPMQLRVQNKWPAVICLGPGERFEDPANGTFSVVSVDQDSVTIEEESERSVKSLPQIK